MLLLTYCHLSNFKSISNWNLIFYCNYYGFPVAENCSINMYMNTLEQKWCWTGSCGVSTSCWETCIGIWFHWHCWYSRYVMFCFIPEPKHKAIFFYLIEISFRMLCHHLFLKYIHFSWISGIYYQFLFLKVFWSCILEQSTASQANHM